MRPFRIFNNWGPYYIYFTGRNCLLYDMMTSGTYFWNILEKTYFLGKILPCGCTYFLRRFYFTDLFLEPSYLLQISIDLTRSNVLLKCYLKVGCLSCAILTRYFNLQNFLKFEIWWNHRKFFYFVNYSNVCLMSAKHFYVSHMWFQPIWCSFINRGSPRIKLYELFETSSFWQYPKKICHNTNFVDHVAKHAIYLILGYLRPNGTLPKILFRGTFGCASLVWIRVPHVPSRKTTRPISMRRFNIQIHD